MEFFDKITKTASKTYKYTTEKTSKLTKEVKLKTMMNQDKEKISEIYEQIGKNVYQSHIRKNDEDILEEIEELCNKIDAYSREIEFTRMELLKLRDLKQCSNCSCEIDLDYHYCPNCGEKQEIEENNYSDNSQNNSKHNIQEISNNNEDIEVQKKDDA